MKKVPIGLLVVLVLLQFIRPSRNESNVATNDISIVYIVPDDVQMILKNACNDCHSNHTNYPRYTNIQPVGWWMQHHVSEGKEELNFNEFAGYKPQKTKS